MVIASSEGETDMTAFEIHSAFIKAVRLSLDLGEIGEAHGRALIDLADEMGNDSWQEMLKAIDHVRRAA